MNTLGKQLLAGAGLAQNSDGKVVSSVDFGACDCGFHHRGLPDNVGKRICGGKAFVVTFLADAGSRPAAMFLPAAGDNGIKAVFIRKVLCRNIDRLAIYLDSLFFYIYLIDNTAVNAFKSLFLKDLIANIALE